MTTMGTAIRLFEHAAENRINVAGVLDSIFDFHGVMIHFGAAVRADHFGAFSHSDYLMAQSEEVSTDYTDYTDFFQVECEYLIIRTY